MVFIWNSSLKYTYVYMCTYGLAENLLCKFICKRKLVFIQTNFLVASRCLLLKMSTFCRKNGNLNPKNLKIL